MRAGFTVRFCHGLAFTSSFEAPASGVGMQVEAGSSR